MINKITVDECVRIALEEIEKAKKRLSEIKPQEMTGQQFEVAGAVLELTLGMDQLAKAVSMLDAKTRGSGI